MTNNVGPVGRSGKVMPREFAIVFPRQFVDPEYETRLGCIRYLVWCAVFEVGLSIAVVLVWTL